MDSHRLTSEQELTRFVGRREYFGSVVYDRGKEDYIPVDHDATEIFDLSQKERSEKVLALFEDRIQRRSFQTFVELCQSIGLFDAEGKFTGAFLDRNWSTEGYLSAPLRVHFSCTKACNFSCRHCFSSSGNQYPGELTTAEIKRLVDE